MIALQRAHGIDPTNGRYRGFFAAQDRTSRQAEKAVNEAFAAGLRRELTEDGFALDPLGLARWDILLPPETGVFSHLSEAETQILLRVVTRILATEKILLPPQTEEFRGWPAQLVEDYDRCVLYRGYRRQERAIRPINTTRAKIGH